MKKLKDTIKEGEQQQDAKIPPKVERKLFSSKNIEKLFLQVSE